MSTEKCFGGLRCPQRKGGAVPPLTSDSRGSQRHSQLLTVLSLNWHFWHFVPLHFHALQFSRSAVQSLVLWHTSQLIPASTPTYRISSSCFKDIQDAELLFWQLQETSAQVRDLLQYGPHNTGHLQGDNCPATHTAFRLSG